VRVRRPTAQGDDCECQSFENVFLPGVEEQTIALSITYRAEGKSGSSKNTGKDDPTSFIMTEDGHVVKVVSKGENAELSVKDALAAFGTCLDCQPEGTFAANYVCSGAGGACPEPYRAKPTPRITGTAVDITSTYYSHRVTMPAMPGYDWIKANYEPPYAIHILTLGEDWTSRGSDYHLDVESAHERVETDVYRYGTLIRLKPAAGIISWFSREVLIGKLVEFSVLAGFPSLLISAIVFMALGRKSKILRAAQRRTVTMPELYRSFTYNALSAEHAFARLDTENKGFLDVDDFKNALRKNFELHLRASCPDASDAWIEQKIDQFAQMLIHTYTLEDDGGCAGSKGAKFRGISKQDFVDGALSNEALSWTDVVDKLKDEQCDRSMLEGAIVCRNVAPACRRREQESHRFVD